MNCPFCEIKGIEVNMPGNICPACFAYKVTEDTHDLSMSQQPWYNQEETEKVKSRIKEVNSSLEETYVKTIKNHGLETDPRFN